MAEEEKPTEAPEEEQKPEAAEKPETTVETPKEEASKEKPPEPKKEKTTKPKKDTPQEGKKKGESKKAEGEKKDEPSVIQRVRVSGVILDGNMSVYRALLKIKGIGPQISRAIAMNLKIDRKVKLGTLDEKQIKEVEDAIDNIHKMVPAWMLNRREDYYTGENLHLTGSELDIALREDINLQKKIRSYKGVRHSLNLPVRGQRTKSSFRKGATLGVRRKRG
jgi:small subunit ribosomal protein S13